MSKLYSTTSMNKVWNASNNSEHHLKSASLPPGLALPSGMNKLSRSRSNAGSKRGDAFPEEDEEERTSKEDKKKEESFFGRFLARRSGKKQTKKSKSEDNTVVKTSEVSSYKQAEEKVTTTVDTVETQHKLTKTENLFSYKQAEEKLLKKNKSEDLNLKTDNFEKQLKKNKSEDCSTTKSNDNQEKPIKKINSEELNLKISENLDKQVKKIKSEDNYLSMQNEIIEKQVKMLKNEEFISKATEVSEKHIKKTSEEINVVKINDNLIIEKQSKKIKSDDFVTKTNETEKQTKKIKSDDYILIKTNDSLSLYKQGEERKNSIDSGVRNSAVPRTGPAARQRIQPIDIPASPDEFRRKRQQSMDMEMPAPPSKSSPEQTSFLLDAQNRLTPPKTQLKYSLDQPLFILQTHHQSPPKARLFHVSRQIKVGSEEKHESEEANELISRVSPKPNWPDSYPDNKLEEKSKIKIAGLSSYQQRVLSYDEHDNGFKSLNENFEENIPKHSVTKSHSFRSKTSITQDLSSAPYVSKSDSTEIFSSNPMLSHDDNRKSVEVEHYDSLNKNEPLSFTSHSDSIDVEKADEQKLEKIDGVTISCVNSQILSSVNTQSSNQVIVSISSNTDIINENTEIETSEASSQVSITRVQLKKDLKSVETKTTLPEFLKIQLNKVDIKPVSNVVLSTSVEINDQNVVKSITKNGGGCETDKENGEILQRKFSKDVEIIDKDTSEEVVEIPKIVNNIQSKITEETNKKQNTIVTINKTERKSSISPPLIKPFLKKKSNSIELSDAAVKSLIQDTQMPEKMSISSEQLNSRVENLKEKTCSTGDIQDSPESVMLRRKSSSSVKKDKDSDEPELMKVFARRSLKLKDSEAETLSQQVMVLVENSQMEQANENNNISNRSRDSDKENEFSESPQEERKKITFQPHSNIKDTKPLNESKFVDTSEVTIRKPINNKIAAFNNPRFQKTISLSPPNVDNVQETRKNKSLIEPKTEKPKIFEKNIHRTRIMALKEKDFDTKKTEVINNKCINNKTNDEVITNVSIKNNEYENEEYVPMFKRISQRKEEWEQRAQQAMKKTVP